jgi:hypothetical protein
MRLKIGAEAGKRHPGIASRALEGSVDIWLLEALMLMQRELFRVSLPVDELGRPVPILSHRAR